MWTLDKSPESLSLSLSELYKIEKEDWRGAREIRICLRLYLYISYSSPWVEKKRRLQVVVVVVYTHIRAGASFLSFFYFFYLFFGRMTQLVAQRDSQLTPVSRQLYAASIFSLFSVCVVDGLPLGLTPFARQSCLVLLLLLLHWPSADQCCAPCAVINSEFWSALSLSPSPTPSGYVSLFFFITFRLFVFLVEIYTTTITIGWTTESIQINQPIIEKMTKVSM